jgi:PIN domain nuclease of toxin-antitoxin system
VRLLLDVSYPYTLVGAPGRLTARERKILTESDAELYVSAVSVWGCA